MDETAIAFEPPHVRAAATQAPGLQDRISVRDYTRDVEIGAFRSERGVTQRVRFNVVLEVSHHAAARTDDVDKVLSYETIVEAIEDALAVERLNLLETLAERVAAGCLADPRANRVFVRIEKLDRIPGALGVEIARARLPDDAARLHEVEPARPHAAARPIVLYLAPHVLARDDVAAWLDACQAGPRAVALALGPSTAQPPATSEGTLRCGLLAIEAAAWAFADRDARLIVVATRAELDWATKTGRLAVWAPAKMITDALPRPDLDASRPAALAAWLAAEIAAEALVVTDPNFAEPVAVPLRRAATPDDLAR